MAYTPLFFNNLLEIARKIFHRPSLEPNLERRKEKMDSASFRQIILPNFPEIFSLRLTNLALTDTKIYTDDEEMNKLLIDLMLHAPKWVQIGIGMGRVYLIPTILDNDQIYTDIVPDDRVTITKRLGNETIGIVVDADIRYQNNKQYHRVCLYEWDYKTKTMRIENKATGQTGTEMPLAIFPEWANITPVVEIKNCEAPLFSYFDSPKASRESDKPEGVCICDGCYKTIGEIYDCMKQYEIEFRNKQAFLGVDRAMMNPDTGKPLTSDGLYVQFEQGGTQDGGDHLFQVYSPDIRSEAYKSRLGELFAQLEKQVGVSAGILTNMTTGTATATEIRRGLSDTIAMIDRIERNIKLAIYRVCKAYATYFDLVGITYNKDYKVEFEWGDILLRESEQEKMNTLTLGVQNGAISAVEMRQYFHPEESIEEATAKVNEIKAERGNSAEMEQLFGGFGG